MSMSGDPFDNGALKYSTASDIYDALREMSTGEEIGILSEMFEDISWDGQDYYYTDNAGKLVERWEHITDYGDKMWLMDVAVWQLSDEDANQWMLQSLYNDDLAKRINFKKLFVDNVLNGMGSLYKDVAEAFAEELHELDRDDYYNNCKALNRVMPEPWETSYCRYNNLCTAVYNKLKGLRLDEERQLIVESRAMLTGYDDFMFGLKANQALYTEQERMYQNKVALLQQKYDAAMQMLLSAAQERGVMLNLPGSPLLIEEGK